jgi:ABC-type enterochelin transport system ATPase subunit
MNGGFRIGPVDEIMTQSVLSDMYGIPVDVDSFNGHRIVVARRDGITDANV